MAIKSIFTTLALAALAISTCIYTNPSSKICFVCFGGFLWLLLPLCDFMDESYPEILVLYGCVGGVYVGLCLVVAFAGYLEMKKDTQNRQRKRKSKPRDPEIIESKHPKKSVPMKPEHDSFARMLKFREYLENVPNRNWSNDHGNLSPEQATPSVPRRSYLPHLVTGNVELDDDSNRNWSNEHGNLSPEPVKSSNPRSDNTRNRLAESKTLDDDNNRNWSNEHGNLSPESLGRGYGDDTPRRDTATSASSTATFTPSSGTSGSGHNRLNITPATTSTFASRDARIFTPTTTSTSGSILTPSETTSISKEEFYRPLGVESSQTSLDRSTGAENQAHGTRVSTPVSTQTFSSSTGSKVKYTPATPESDKTSERVYTPSSALAAGRFDIADHLKGDYGEYPEYLKQNSPTSSDTGSDVTAIYTLATTGSITSSSQSEMDGVMYTPSSTDTSGSEDIYTPSFAGT